MLLIKIEQHMDPAIREARDKTIKALAEAEQGLNERKPSLRNAAD